ncbi:AMP-binding protein [bacterium]|nr:AMP-binding protein [bacterium]
MLLVHQFLEDSAKRYPDKTCLVFQDRRLTYSEVEAQANALSRGLVQKGVRRGDRVILWHDNSVETCVALFAVLKAGAAFVALNPAVKRDKFLFVAQNCRARLILTSDGRLSQVRDGLWEACPEAQVVTVGDTSPSFPKVSSYDELVSCHPASPPGVRCIDRDLAGLIYTSGSTGAPKGVMYAHHNIVAAATSITRYLGNTPEDIILSALPLAFVYGLYQLLMTFLVGGTLVLERSFAFPLKVVEAMRRERVTGFPGVPSMFSMLLSLSPHLLTLPDLRTITNAGAALPVPHIARLRGLFPHVRIFSMYGQTECARTLYLPPEELDRRPDSVGIPIPNEEVFVVDEQGNEVPPGEVGELMVRGANVSLGYWENPEETARTFVPGHLPGERLLRSGDLFRRDEEGFLYFVARKDNLIKSRGQKVSPREVEAVLHQIAGVLEAVVIGVEHPLWGEAVQAHVVLDRGARLNERSILGRCRASLEDFMVPQGVVFHDALPRTASGKVDYTALREGDRTTRRNPLRPIHGEGYYGRDSRDHTPVYSR